MKSILISVFLVLFSASAIAEPALRIVDDNCNLLSAGLTPIQTNDSKVTLTFSKNGNMIRKCKFKGSDNPYEEEIVFDFDYFDSLYKIPVLCTTSLILDDEEFEFETYDWRQVISEDGNIMLTCQFTSHDLID